METYAMVDVEAPDLQRFPALARARGLETTLEAGDVLWLPAFWFHHVRQLDAGRENLSLNCWVGTQQRAANLGATKIAVNVGDGVARQMEAAARANAARRVATSIEAELRACLRVSADGAAETTATAAEAADEALLESAAFGLWALLAVQHLETKVRAAVGSMAAAGQLLNALAAGADMAPPDGSPLGAHGSPTHLAAMQLRVSLVQQFGAAGAAALLRMCTRHGRLHPGPPA
eukprot:81224-Prymnesium_polylepis.1